MPSALDRLVSLRDAPERHDIPLEDVQSLQIEAANERFESRIDAIPLLRNRAGSAGISKVTSAGDLVPLLFAHNTYKTYAEPWLQEGQWDRMAKWLQTVSTYQADGRSFTEVADLDDWVTQLEEQGLYVGCSSGTTGKPAMLGSTRTDLEFSAKANVSGFAWATGVVPAQDRKVLGLGPRMKVARNEFIRDALVAAFASPDEETYQLPVPIITVSSIMNMIVLRRRIADGTAKASDIAEFERISKERQASLSGAADDAIETLIKSRDKKLFLMSMFASLYDLAAGIREAGYSGKDFQPDNALLTGGGLKGANLPPDYREIILDTFNLSEQRIFQLYSMQELNTPFPRCAAARYHIAPWVIALPLDTPGEQLLDAGTGEIEARAAFFDLSLDGRWGGVISGDRISLDMRPCACGHQGPTVGPEIVRYSDLESGDKISCAGTIDAYVRGES